MIKKMFRGIGRIVKPFVNVSAWANVRQLKENQQRLSRLTKVVLTPTQVETKRETFENAVVRLGLDEAMLQARQRSFKQLAIVYLLLAAFIFIYACYLLIIVQALLAFIMALVVVWIVLVLAFRQHFWYTQMKVRRLGLSFREWFSITFHVTKEVKR